MNDLTTNPTLPGIVLLPTPRYEDDRGYFMETFRVEWLRRIVGSTAMVQDNLSCSRRGVFRGMHAQQAPYAQAKLVRVVAGHIIDYVLDIDPSSPTYGQWEAFDLKESTPLALYIPRGYAHGFVSLEDHTLVHYKVDAPYHPQCEICYHYSTSGIGTDALRHLPQGSTLQISAKDLKGIELPPLTR